MARRPPGGERTGTPADYLVVGLGNPGAEYAETRHNVGAEVVELLAQRHDARLRDRKQQARADEVRLDGSLVALAIPNTYMNESGIAVGKLVHRYATVPENIVIVQDELDLPVATLRLKAGGGLAGHNGLRSIVSHLGTDEFLRVRIGVGKPPDARQGADHVLRRFSKSERKEVDVTIERAADAVECIVADGVDAAMTRFNVDPP
ncbi:MAG: aminoacyl-tRNA hydrolase [Acidimicrobiia bacterium]|nr:aminoacyl-tRNA hydrolase [Acidimicrobiia bacterium]